MVGLFRGSQGQGSVCSLPAPPTVAKCPAFSSQGFARVPDCCLQDGWVRSFFRRRLEPGSFPSAPDLGHAGSSSPSLCKDFASFSCLSTIPFSHSLPCLQPQSQIHSQSKIRSPALMKAQWRGALFPRDQLQSVSWSLCFSGGAPRVTRGRAGSAQKTNPLMLGLTCLRTHVGAAHAWVFSSNVFEGKTVI